MEEEGLCSRGENVGNEFPIEIERQPLFSHNQPTYMRFRLGRQPQPPSRCTGLVLFAFKVTFCSLGLWGHQAWNYIPRVLLSVICVYQTAFVLSSDLGCPIFDCSHYQSQSNDTPPNVSDADARDSLQTVSVYRTLFSVAALLSYLVMIGCFITTKSKDSAMVPPSASMRKDIQRKSSFLLFAAFVFINTSLSGVFVTFFKLASLFDGSKYGLAEAGVAAQLLALVASVNTCHVFAISSFTLSTLAQDASRLIRDLQNGTLDDVIKIHEDLCLVVFNTVSAYSVWFVVHWFTYGVGIVVAVIFMSEFLFFWDKYPVFYKVTMGFFLICFFYMFILPCACAAWITSSCAGIYEKINSTTSNDWSEGHPFKDRHNIALFVSYAKERRCGFKVGRITFNTSLAWLSFFFGLTALLFHFL